MAPRINQPSTHTLEEEPQSWQFAPSAQHVPPALHYREYPLYANCCLHSLSMGREQFAAQSMLGLLAARSQLQGSLAPLLNLHKVGKFQRYANVRRANPRGHQSTNWRWAVGVMLTLPNPSSVYHLR